MPPNDSTPELNANGSLFPREIGAVTTVLTLTQWTGNAGVRLNASPTRTFAVSVIGPGAVWHAPVDNAGVLGAWVDVQPGSSFAVTGHSQVVLKPFNDTSTLRCVAA